MTMKIRLLILGLRMMDAGKDVVIQRITVLYGGVVRCAPRRQSVKQDVTVASLVLQVAGCAFNAAKQGTYSFDVPCRLSSGCNGGCPPPSGET